jgi:hypothetical protein
MGPRTDLWRWTVGGGRCQLLLLPFCRCFCQYGAVGEAAARMTAAMDRVKLGRDVKCHYIKLLNLLNLNSYVHGYVLVQTCNCEGNRFLSRVNVMKIQIGPVRP